MTCERDANILTCESRKYVHLAEHMVTQVLTNFRRLCICN